MTTRASNVPKGSRKRPAPGGKPPGGRRRPCRRLLASLAAGAILALAAAIAYSNSLHVPLVYDDHDAIDSNPTIRRLWPLTQSMWPPPLTTASGRPVVNFSLAVNYALGELEPRGYHVFNIAVHALSGLVLFGLVRRTLRLRRLRGRLGRHCFALALAAAGVWTLHPLQTESVTYVIQRAESLMGLFFLLTMYCALRAWARRARWLWAVAAMLFCAMGMASKEVMAVAPVMVVLYDRVFMGAPRRAFRRILRRRWMIYAMLAATWAILAVMVLTSPRGQSAGFHFKDLSPLDYLRTQFGVVLYYLRLSVWPHPLVMDYNWPVARQVTEYLPQAIAVGTLVIATLYGLARRKALGFLGAWFFLILAPSSSIIPIITEVASEHRMYLPLAAVVLLAVVAVFMAGQVLLKWLLRPAAPRAVGLGLGTLLVLAACVTSGYVTYHRNIDYRSEPALWANNLRWRPDNYKALSNYAAAMVAQAEAQKLDPPQMATCLREARSRLEEAVRLKPDYFPAMSNLGSVYLKLGDYVKAYEYCSEAIRLKEDFAEAHSNLGDVLSRLHRTVEAAAHYRRAIELNPASYSAMHSLAWILAAHPDPNVRNGKEALKLALQVAQHDQYQDFNHLDTLAAAHAETGEFAQAAAVMRQAIVLAGRTAPQPIVAQLQQRLRQYQSQQPTRDESLLQAR